MMDDPVGDAGARIDDRDAAGRRSQPDFAWRHLRKTRDLVALEGVLGARLEHRRGLGRPWRDHIGSVAPRPHPEAAAAVLK
jgi:hypothetical protein